eukprot:TRINITY_DN3627_c0_g1_i9.p1 TRINITY_DN3627_c0_g1~~TRINITY_DN3627_c0_g1_i9.p1  ORF type:complete len:494 (-),score=38.94 TRINITY_DN3627_c0_g1_i9:542-2023(-)
MERIRSYRDHLGQLKPQCYNNKITISFQFVKTFIYDYIFELQQPIKFQAIDVDNAQVTSFDFIGETETNIGTLVGSKNQTLVLDLKDHSGKKGGKIILRCDKVQSSMEVLKIKLAGKKIKNLRWFMSNSSPFLRFFRSKEGGNASYLIHQTEVIMHNLNPSWKEFEINLGKICSGDHYQPIKVEVWDYHSNGAHKLIGDLTFTIDELETQHKNNFIFTLGTTTVGTLIVQSHSIIIRPQFLDYIRGGTQLALVTAIDFTSSNGYPHRADSLHSYTKPGLNSYQKAIKSVGEVLMNYDYDKLVPAYAFGGKPKMPNLNSGTVMHCFPLNGNVQNPDVYNIDGIMEAYDFALHNSELSGPTLFYPIIKQTMDLCIEWKNEGSNQYAILLILTDGCIHDMDQTKTALVDSAFLPLSIIIIGIGNADFSNMEILDGDDGLWDSKGRKAQRDLVQFVPFNQFNGDPIKLAEEVLEELPRQLVEYMVSIKKNAQSSSTS